MSQKAQDGHSALIEHVIDVKNESLRGYDLKVGDIVDETLCRRLEGVAIGTRSDKVSIVHISYKFQSFCDIL